jgi:hypothetical protein
MVGQGHGDEPRHTLADPDREARKRAIDGELSQARTVFASLARGTYGTPQPPPGGAPASLLPSPRAILDGEWRWQRQQAGKEAALATTSTPSLYGEGVSSLGKGLQRTVRVRVGSPSNPCNQCAWIPVRAPSLPQHGPVQRDPFSVIQGDGEWVSISHPTAVRTCAMACPCASSHHTIRHLTGAVGVCAAWCRELQPRQQRAVADAAAARDRRRGGPRGPHARSERDPARE